MEKQISIIIPTYNMEKYIGKCLDSLLIPEFDQVEVLVVNDGSKDRSSEIAHSYADRYPGSIRVIDKPNGNYGSCINAALPLATGRYVKVLDADDTFDTEAFSELVRMLADIDDDAVVTPFTVVDTDGNILVSRGFDTAGVNLNRTYRLAEYDGEFDDYQIQMHQLVYKKSVFDKFTYHQTEGISYTDSEWATIPFSMAATYRCMTPNVTRYLSGREGQTLSSAQISKNFSNFITMLRKIMFHYAAMESGDRARYFLKRQLMHLNRYVYFKALAIWSQSVSEKISDFDRELHKIAPDIYESIGRITYDETVSFRVFNDLRNKGYRPDYKVPFSVRLKVSLSKRFPALFRNKW